MDFHVGTQGYAWLTSKLNAERNQTIGCNANMTELRSGHRTDPTVDILAFGLSLLLERQVFFDAMILRLFCAAHHAWHRIDKNGPSSERQVPIYREPSGCEIDLCDDRAARNEMLSIYL